MPIEASCIHLDANSSPVAIQVKNPFNEEFLCNEAAVRAKPDIKLLLQQFLCNFVYISISLLLDVY
jgi:hypothetical protein